jgi:Ca2+-binding RTX toxin-like protein
MAGGNMSSAKRALATRQLGLATMAAALLVVSGLTLGTPAQGGSGICNGFVASDEEFDASGSYGPAFIQGSDDDDVIVGSLGDDIIDGGDGDDYICGSDGDDDLNGGDGNDVLRGQFGDDGPEGDAGVDTVTGDEGNDDVRGGDGSDIVWGGVGDDRIIGSDEDDFAPDKLDGYDGMDQCFPGPGDEIKSCEF